MGVLAGQPQHRVSEADLDVLEMITHIPPRSSVAAPSLQNRALDTVAALRRPPIDPIVLAASLGSGPNVTRHHFHHTYADTHSAHLSGHSQQMPVSERRKRAMEAASRPPPPPTAPAPQPQEDEQFESSSMFVSCQAPRSVRLARARHAAEIRAKAAEVHAAAENDMDKADQMSPVAPNVRSQKTMQSSPPLEVRCCGRTRVPTPHGEVFCHLYRNNHDAKEHLALVIDPSQNTEELWEKQRSGLLGTPRHIRSTSLDAMWHANETPMERLVRGAYVHRLSETCQDVAPVQSSSANDTEYPAPLVRIHSECYTGETIGSQRCDCGEQLDEALRIISTTMTMSKGGRPVPPRGVVVYMRQEGRGIGLLDKLLAYNLQDMGHDTVSANVLLGHLPDARKYDISSAILRDLGIDECRLLTNNPEKMQALEAEGIRVQERVPMVPRMWQFETHAHHHRHVPRSRRKRTPHARRRVSDSLRRRPRPSSVQSQADPEGSSTLDASDAAPRSVGTDAEPRSGSTDEFDDSDDAWDDEEDVLSDASALSFNSYTLRNTGATLIGGSVTRGSDLERYLRTKVERMGHLLTIPHGASTANKEHNST